MFGGRQHGSSNDESNGPSHDDPTDKSDDESNGPSGWKASSRDRIHGNPNDKSNEKSDDMSNEKGPAGCAPAGPSSCGVTALCRRDAASRFGVSVLPCGVTTLPRCGPGGYLGAPSTPSTWRL